MTTSPKASSASATTPTSDFPTAAWSRRSCKPWRSSSGRRPQRLTPSVPKRAGVTDLARGVRPGRFEAWPAPTGRPTSGSVPLEGEEPKEQSYSASELARRSRGSASAIRRAANLQEQSYQAVLVGPCQVRSLAPRFDRQVTELTPLIRAKTVPKLPAARVQPDDRRDYSAPRDPSCRRERLQDPSRHLILLSGAAIRCALVLVAAPRTASCRSSARRVVSSYPKLRRDLGLVRRLLMASNG